MKKNYITPETTIVNLYTETNLLGLSTEEDASMSDGTKRSNERDNSIWGNSHDIWGDSEE